MDSAIQGVGIDTCSATCPCAARRIGRYKAIIHLRTPGVDLGYDHSNPLRTEDPAAAAEIDTRIEQAWRDHPRRTIIDANADFPTKAGQALAAIAVELPSCCHPEPS